MVEASVAFLNFPVPGSRSVVCVGEELAGSRPVARRIFWKLLLWVVSDLNLSKGLKGLPRGGSRVCLFSRGPTSSLGACELP